MRDDKRTARGARGNRGILSRQGPSLATVALEGKTYTVTAEESHARFLIIATAVAQEAERLAHTKCCRSSEGGSWRLDNRALRRGHTRVASSVHVAT